MAEEMEVQNEGVSDIIITGIDILSIGIGGIVGVAGAQVVDGLLPVAETAVEVVRNKAVKYGTGVTLQWLTSTAVNEDLNEIASFIHGLASSRKLKKLKKAEESKEN